MPDTVCMLVYNYYPSETGGAEKQCRLQAHELVRRGYRCLVITARTSRNAARRENDQGCEIFRSTTFGALVGGGAAKSDQGRSVRQAAGNRRPWLSTGAAALMIWLNAGLFLIEAAVELYRRRKEIDILHAHIADWNAGFAGWIGHLLGIPVLVKAAFLPAFPKIKGVPFASLWKKWRMRASYIALNESMADDLLREGVPAERVNLISNGVMIPDVATDAGRNSLVLYVGNLSQGAAHKGFDVLFKAWAQVHSEMPSARMIVAGGGDATPWVQMAGDLGCQESVRFLGHVGNMPELYQTAGVFILPSRSEGVSNALLEAQSHGIPAVASDIPGNRAVINHKETGVLVPVDDIESFATNTICLLGNPDLRQEMGRAARRRVMERYSISMVVDKVCAVYRSMKANRKYTGEDCVNAAK